MIPFRLDNDFVSDKATEDHDNVDPDWQEIYTLAKKALKKGTNGGKYTKIEEELRDSDDIGDMDYIYAVYGVSLNCLDQWLGGTSTTSSSGGFRTTRRAAATAARSLLRTWLPTRLPTMSGWHGSGPTMYQ